MLRHGAVYLAATGGGALLARQIVASRVVAYADLGPEAIHLLQLRDFPAIVAVDATGADLYDLGPAAYARPGRLPLEGASGRARQAQANSTLIQPPLPAAAVQRLRLLRRGHVAQQGVDPQLPAGDQAVARPGCAGASRASRGGA